MKISTKGRYALRMLLDLAEHDEEFIPLKEIAARQNISKQYLEQIVSLLNTSDIIRANRGKQGGYQLAKDPSHITVGQVLRITEGSLAPVACLDDEINMCERASFCKTLPLWQGLNKVITDYLDSVNLQSMLAQYKERSSDLYVI
jgi:Rrf2 family protein